MFKDAGQIGRYINQSHGIVFLNATETHSELSSPAITLETNKSAFHISSINSVFVLRLKNLILFPFLYSATISKYLFHEMTC